jgi:predicted GNAT family acetyltransferase
MPVVRVKGVANPMQFPDDMDIEDIKAFLQRRFANQAVAGNQLMDLAPLQGQARASEQSLAQKAGQGISNALVDSGIVSDRFGAQKIGKNVTSIGEFLPGIGDATAGDEFGRALKQGDNFGMAMGALGAIPLVGDAAKKAFKGKVFHQTNSDFDEFDFDKTSDGTVWFTDNKANFSDPNSSAGAAAGKGRIIERDVELNNVAGYDELDKYSVDELVQQGYDGAFLDGDIQVFDPKAIKTPSTDKAMSVSGDVTSKFNPKLMDTEEGFQIQTDNGKLDGLSLGDDFMVKTSKVEEGSRGKGEGIELYLNAIEEARKKGFKRLVSDDDTVDAPAIRIYEALERRGYKVDKHPDFRLVTELEGSDFAHAGDNSAFSIDLSK